MFIDTNPKIVEDEKWKMLVRMNNQNNTETDTYVLSSHDGINWKKMFESPSMHRSDTQNVAWYDNEIDEYVIFMRIDDLNPKEHSGPYGACQGPLPQLSSDFRDGSEDAQRKILAISNASLMVALKQQMYSRSMQ